MTAPRVLGLDLSLSCTGITANGWTDTIRTKPRRAHEDPREFIHARRAHIRCTLTDQYLSGNTYDLAVIEDASYGSPDAGHQLAGLRWMVRHLLWQHDIPYALVPPASLKIYAADNGGASKADVRAAVSGWFVTWFTGGTDEADAAVLMAMGHDWLGDPICPPPPRRAMALAGCDWPTLLVSERAA